MKRIINMLLFSLLSWLFWQMVLNLAFEVSVIFNDPFVLGIR
jgi:hypothetical protein